MVKLFCAIVGAAGSVFPVDIDESQSVGDLKKEIKKENSATITCDAKDLQLFLAKKDEGRGPWVTEADVKGGVSDTHDLKLLDVAGAPLKWVDLSEDDVRFQITKELVKAKKTPVHVLVVVPEGVTGAEATQDTEMSPLSMIRKQCKVVGDLNYRTHGIYIGSTIIQ